MGWLKDLVDKGQEVSRMGQFPAHQHFMFFGNKNDEDCGLPEVWFENGHNNIPWLDENKDRIDSVYNMPKISNKVVIFVGMGESLGKYWKHLKGLNDNYVICATNSSAKFLLDRKIKPHYIMAIDGKKGNWTMDLGEDASDITAIFSVCTEPEAMRSWKGKIMIVPYGVKDKSLKKKIERRYGKGIPSGGNALNSAVAVFYQFTEADKFLFLGNDLSFKKSYYADRPNPNDESGYVFATNIFGKRVKTLIPLFEYKVWLENMAAQLWPKYHFCNCSEGILGVDVDGSLMPCIAQKRLDFAIEDIREAYSVEKGEKDSYKEIYDHFYHVRFGNNERGTGIWKYITQHHEFKKGIDVGCGYGNGVKWARDNGYDVYGCDIAEAKDIWKEQGIADYCRMEPAYNMSWEDGEFDMVVCSEVMEHIPEELTLDALREMARIGSDKFIFTINLKPEEIPIAGYVQTHINLHTPKWWVDKFEEAGLTPMFVNSDDDLTDISVYAVKDADIYLRGERDISKFGAEFPMLVLGTCSEEKGMRYAL